MSRHGLKEVNRAGDIVFKITQRLFDGFTDGFKAGEMNNGGKFGGGKDLVESGEIK